MSKAYTIAIASVNAVVDALAVAIAVASAAVRESVMDLAVAPVKVAAWEARALICRLLAREAPLDSAL
jgi:hypothetical protein